MSSPSLPVQTLLRGVSRSLGVSMRLLPGPLRDPVGLAYLLARLSDTVADTPGLEVAQRLHVLHGLCQALHEPAPNHALAQDLRGLAPLIPHPHERELLLHAQACLSAFHKQSSDDRAAMHTVLDAITEGQCWDLQVFGEGAPGVQTQQDIERYTWQVAGSVGEFWTHLCALHLQHWHRDGVDMPRMLQWASHYGQGLQRLNILRDAGDDLRMGRCYWPVEELSPLGLHPAQLCTAARLGDADTLARLQPLLTQWQHTTQALLQDGLRYCLALRGWRLRLASALPCLIGIQTLALLRQAGPLALTERIKLPRPQVRKLLWQLLRHGVSDRALLQAWDAAACTCATPDSLD